MSSIIIHNNEILIKNLWRVPFKCVKFLCKRSVYINEGSLKRKYSTVASKSGSCGTKASFLFYVVSFLFYLQNATCKLEIRYLLCNENFRKILWLEVDRKCYFCQFKRYFHIWGWQTNWLFSCSMRIFIKKIYQCCVHTNIFYQKRKTLNMISVKLSWTSNDLKLIETFSSQIQNTSNVILFEIQTLFALQIISEGPCTIFITVIQSIHDVTRAQHNSKTRYKQYTATQVQKRS